jgi:hypothetical protein
MRVGVRELVEMIEEELSNFEEANLYHSPATGRWASKKAGNVYSLTKRGAKNAPHAEVGKGVVTKTGKVRSKYGLPQSCGRISIDGEDINPEYSCAEFKKKYAEEIEGEPEIHTPVGEIEILKLDGKLYFNLDSLLSQSPEDQGGEAVLQEETRKELISKCNQYGLYTRNQVLDRLAREINALKLAEDGKYLVPQKAD